MACVFLHEDYAEATNVGAVSVLSFSKN